MHHTALCSRAAPCATSWLHGSILQIHPRWVEAWYRLVMLDGFACVYASGQEHKVLPEVCVPRLRHKRDESEMLQFIKAFFVALRSLMSSPSMTFSHGPPGLLKIWSFLMRDPACLARASLQLVFDKFHTANPSRQPRHRNHPKHSQMKMFVEMCRRNDVLRRSTHDDVVMESCHDSESYHDIRFSLHLPMIFLPAIPMVSVLQPEGRCWSSLRGARCLTQQAHGDSA